MMKDWKRRWFFIQVWLVRQYELTGRRMENSFTQELRIYQTPPQCLFAIFSFQPVRLFPYITQSLAVRENVLSDTRFTFEVISPGQRIYTLQVPCTVTIQLIFSGRKRIRY